MCPEHTQHVTHSDGLAVFIVRVKAGGRVSLNTEWPESYLAPQR